MYQEYFGFRELPFELTANTRFLFLTSKQREALSILQYGLFSAKSITLLVGDAGTGKTTLIHAALESERCRDVRCVYLNNPMLSSADFVTFLSRQFQLGPEAESSKAMLLERLEAKLRESRAAGEITALVVDEAQSLTTELLEEVRLLANIETPTEKLLPVVLAGQPELADRLEQPRLRQLKQRVALRCELEPFELGDTAAYIARRIHTAGGVPAEMFTQEAVRLIHDRSRGIPRIINVICDNALIGTMAMGYRRVEQAMINEVCRDLRLSGASTGWTPGTAAAGAGISDDGPIYGSNPSELVSESPRADETEPARDGEAEGNSRFNFRLRWPDRLNRSAKVAE
jgi:general secretion pathway protein A